MAGALDRYKEAVLWDFIRIAIPEAWDCFYVAGERLHYGCYEEGGDTGTVWVHVEQFPVQDIPRANALEMMHDLLSESLRITSARGGDTAEFLPPRSDTHVVQIYNFQSVDENDGAELVHLHTTHAGWTSGKLFMVFFALVMTGPQAANELHDLCRTMTMNMAKAQIDWDKAVVPGTTRRGPADLVRFRRVLFWHFVALDLPVGWDLERQESRGWGCFPLEGDEQGSLFVDFNIGKVRSVDGGDLPPGEVRDYLEQVAEHGRTAEGGGYETAEIVDIGPNEGALRQTWRYEDDRTGEPWAGTSWMYARWDPPRAIHVYSTLYLPETPPAGDHAAADLPRRLEESMRKTRIDWAEAGKRLDAGTIAPPKR